MTALLRSFLLTLALVWTVASAQSLLPPGDEQAIRQVVEAQLDAFRKDDAARAFSLATPGIRETFGTAERFLGMVRQDYAVVYRPASVVFEPAVEVKGQVIQAVRLTDAEGRAWLALYPMERQPDGQWRTNGCHLSRVPGQRT